MTTPSADDILPEVIERHAAGVVALRAGGAALSGLVWREGLVVTAEEALPEGEIEAVLPGGERRAAALAGRDPTTDVALLRVEGAAAPVAWSTAAPRPGEAAAALGARDGLPLVAAGVVAFAGPAWRSLRGGTIDARLEFDLALVAEAEGGLMLGAGGAALGMAVLGPRGRAIAIPAATIDRVAPQLEAEGRIARGYVGLGLRPIRIDGGGRGLLVVNVARGGPGERAGLRQGDIVTELDGEELGGMRGLMRALGPERVNTAATLRFRRGGEPREAIVAIAERPAH